MPFPIDESKVAWPHSTNYGALLTIDGRSGEILGECRLPGGSVFYNRIFHRDEQTVFLGARGAVLRLERAAETEWTGMPLDRKNIPKRIREQHTPVTGAPMLQLKPLSETWAAQTGATVPLGFELSNTGGAVTGVEVEISGEAIERGIVQPKRARIGASHSEFSSMGKVAKLRLDDFLIPSATEKGTKRTKVEAAVVKPIEIELVGRSAGSAFLMIRVKAGSGVTSATGKSIQVRE